MFVVKFADGMFLSCNEYGEPRSMAKRPHAFLASALPLRSMATEFAIRATETFNEKTTIHTVREINLELAASQDEHN